MSKRRVEPDPEPAGCITIIIYVTILWALVFGVTYGGKHYGIACSCERGVEVGQ